MLMDLLKGPLYKAQIQVLEAELRQLHQRCELTETELNLLKDKYLKLLTLAKTFSALDAYEIDQELEKRKKSLEEFRRTISNAKNEQREIASDVEILRKEILVLEETRLLESFALYIPKFKFTSSLQYKQRLDGIRAKQKEMIKSGLAATGNMNWEVNGKRSEGKKLVTDMIKLVLRSFNNECDHCVDNVKFDNIELGEKRILQSFDACNKLGRVMSVSLSNEYLELKIDELRLAHEFQVKCKEEKEEAKTVALLDGTRLNAVQPDFRMRETKRKDLEGKEALVMGNHLHACLSTLNHFNSWEDSLSNYIFEHTELQPYEKELLSNQVKATVMNDSFQKIFKTEDEVLTEHDVQINVREVARPDRIHLNAEYIEVYDFKTGAEMDKHLQQVKNYMIALRSATDKPVRGYLAYTKTGTLKEVSL